MAKPVVVLASTTNTDSGSPFTHGPQNLAQFKGVRLFLDISAASGTTPTLDAKVQVQDPATGEWADLPGASWAQQTTTTAAPLPLTIYPGVAETANESVNDLVGEKLRVHVTIGGTTPSFTYTIGATLLD